MVHVTVESASAIGLPEELFKSTRRSYFDILRQLTNVFWTLCRGSSKEGQMDQCFHTVCILKGKDTLFLAE